MVNFEIIEGDILDEVRWADAIVNCANAMLIHGGGICGTIFDAAGEKLEKACKEFKDKKVTESIITDGFGVPCKIIHAIGPRYSYEKNDNREKLLQTYQNVIKIAEKNKIEKLAMPLISSGIYGYPLSMASEVAIDFLRNIKSDVIKDIKLVLYTKVYYLICKERLEQTDL